jgi:molybdopterin-binding protein
MKKISVRNHIEGKVAKLTSDKVLTEVIVETAVGHLASVITTRSAKQMKLKVGLPVHFMVKATEAFILRSGEEVKS